MSMTNTDLIKPISRVERVRRLYVWENAVRAMGATEALRKKFKMAIYCRLNTFRCCTAACALGTAAFVPEFQGQGLIPMICNDIILLTEEQVAEFKSKRGFAKKQNYLWDIFRDNKEVADNFDAGSVFFGLTDDEITDICAPGSYGLRNEDNYNNITPEEAADKIAIYRKMYEANLNDQERQELATVLPRKLPYVSRPNVEAANDPAGVVH